MNSQGDSVGNECRPGVNSGGGTKACFMGQVSWELEVWVIRLLQSLRQARDTPGPGARGPNSTLETPRRQSCRPVRLATTTALPQATQSLDSQQFPFWAPHRLPPSPSCLCLCFPLGPQRFSSWKVSLGSAGELGMSGV